MLLTLIRVSQAEDWSLLVVSTMREILTTIVDDLVVLIQMQLTESILQDLAIALSPPATVPLSAVAELRVKRFISQLWIIHPSTAGLLAGLRLVFTIRLLLLLHLWLLGSVIKRPPINLGHPLLKSLQDLRIIRQSHTLSETRLPSLLQGFQEDLVLLIRRTRPALTHTRHLITKENRKHTHSLAKGAKVPSYSSIVVCGRNPLQTIKFLRSLYTNSSPKDLQRPVPHQGVSKDQFLTKKSPKTSSSPRSLQRPVPHQKVSKDQFLTKESPKNSSSPRSLQRSNHLQKNLIVSRKSSNTNTILNTGGETDCLVTWERREAQGTQGRLSGDSGGSGGTQGGLRGTQ